MISDQSELKQLNQTKILQIQKIIPKYIQRVTAYARAMDCGQPSHSGLTFTTGARNI